MTAPEVELRAAWHQLAGRTHEQLLERVLARHREPHRRYHTATHVMWVLRHVHDLAAAGPAPTDLAALQFAALYHDAVYDARSSDNEARSAALAVATAAELGWPAPRRSLVQRLILATAGHAAADDDEAMLVDADLAILGADPNDYAAYERGVRAEYSHVTDEGWRAGRSAVLHALLAMPQIYSTELMHDSRETRARANMTAELAELAGPATTPTTTPTNTPTPTPTPTPT